jgi:DNA-binding LytR/AlgR family response regulator
MEKRQSTNPYYPDIALFVVAIPFISAFNYYLTYSNIRLSWFLLLTFSIDTFQGYVAWWAVRSFILFLDKKLPYEHGAMRRILVQVISTMLIGLIIIAALTELVSWIAKGTPAPVSFYTVDLFIISIWFFVINGIYIGFHYYNQLKKFQEERQIEKRLNSDGLVVRQGKHDIRLNFENVAGFYVDGEYVVVSQMAGKKYYLDQSLDKVEQSLPSSVFFRLNRQFILHRQLVTGFRRADNGKLQVLLQQHENFPPEITVSRTKASVFKDWFQPG